MKPLFTVLFVLIALIKVSAQSMEIPEARWTLVEQFLKQQKDVSGFFMVGQGERIRAEAGLGFADRARQIPFSRETMYSIGSITKPFTATAILLLMERGLLLPNDRITKYFDGVPSDKQEITLHQLLTHSSGLPDVVGDDYEAITTTAFQVRAFATPLRFAPGTGYDYSNTGYSLLGMIIEKISGESYSDFLEKNIFQPAGMITAGYTNPNADYGKLAHGYFQDGTDWGTAKDKKWNGAEPYWNLKSNGGILMTAQDLFQWYLALRNHIILKPETLALQVTPHVRENEMESYYGYGYAVTPDGEIVQHNGGNRIFKADFRWFPKKDLFLIAVTNDANVRLFRLNDQIMDILMTGNLPEMITWENVPLNQFPSGGEQVVAQKFLDLLHTYSPDAGKTFIDLMLTADMLKRNDVERIQNLFARLSKDIGKGAIEKMESSEHMLQITLSGREPQMKLKLKLVFVDDKIDRIGAEMGG